MPPSLAGRPRSWQTELPLWSSPHSQPLPPSPQESGCGSFPPWQGSPFWAAPGPGRGAVDTGRAGEQRLLRPVPPHPTALVALAGSGGPFVTPDLCLLCWSLWVQAQWHLGWLLEPGMDCVSRSLHWPEGSRAEDGKRASREGMSLSKHNRQYHKLFKDVPLEETVLKACSCALQRDLLLQGRLYISARRLCFHASLFGKDIKVTIPVLSVTTVRKHKLARLLPNGLAITTSSRQKYVFVSLLSRDRVYELLRRVCAHLQPSGKKSLSIREFPVEPRPPANLTPEMTWRKPCRPPRPLSLPSHISSAPQEAQDGPDSLFPRRKPPATEDSQVREEQPQETSRGLGEQRVWDDRLLKVFFLLLCILVLSSSYLALRISRLEQQLCSLSRPSPRAGCMQAA